ncbi:MAG: hypothetical protein ACJA1L_002961, partial [Paracoccaceae bacterium]
CQLSWAWRSALKSYGKINSCPVQNLVGGV